MSGWKVSLAVAAIVCGIQFAAAQQAADTVLYNGKVLTVDRNFSVAESVAVRDGKIAAVGKTDEVLKLAGPSTLKIDLKGRTLIPGLINTHLHVDSPDAYGNELPAARRKTYPLNFRVVKTKDDVIKQIKDTITAFRFQPGEWIFFPTNPRGDQSRLIFDELNRWELDKAAPDNPIALTIGLPMNNGLLVNSKAIEALWGKHRNFVETYGRYWVDASGRPEGHLEPPAVRIILEEFLPYAAPEDIGPLFRKVLEESVALGVTTVSGSLPTRALRAYQWLDARGEMPLRYGYGMHSTFGIPGADMKQYKMGAGTDTVWLTSVSARAVDGSSARMCITLKRDAQAWASVDAEDAALAEWWPRGQCHMDIEYKGSRGAPLRANYFKEWYREVAYDGLRSANVHVAGDASYSLMLSNLEEIENTKPGAVKGWALDHCRAIDPRDVPRIAKLGLMMSCKAGEIVTRRAEWAAAFGEQVAQTYFEPVKSLLDAGVNVSLETEGDGVYWQSMEALVARKDKKGKVWGPDQRVDRATALRIATQNGANYVLKGDKLGSIEPGKFADLVVLDRDYMTIPEDDISETRSLMTMMGGKPVFLRTDFANEYNLRPEGAIISTYQELQKRRPAR